jgi:hypothetical protein
LIVLNRKNKETGFSTYLKNLPKIRYVFPKNRVRSMFIPKIPLWIYTVLIEYRINGEIYIYAIWRCCWNVATYEWKIRNGKFTIDVCKLICMKQMDNICSFQNSLIKKLYRDDWLIIGQSFSSIRTGALISDCYWKAWRFGYEWQFNSVYSVVFCGGYNLHTQSSKSTTLLTVTRDGIDN